MDKSQLRIRPIFLKLLLLCVLLVFLLPIISIFFTDRNYGARARILNVMNDERLIASTLGQRAAEIGGLTNIDNDFVVQTMFGPLRLNYHPDRTNSQGGILDIWKTPFRIEFIPPTNFVVCSAGPDKKFGDADDINFNSASNDFVKP
jgi:hypothetical protein